MLNIQGDTNVFKCSVLKALSTGTKCIGQTLTINMFPVITYVFLFVEKCLNKDETRNKKGFGILAEPINKKE